MNAPIDTQAFADRFTTVGFRADQARALATAFAAASELGRDDLVTREFLRAELAELKVELIREIATVGKDVNSRLWQTVAIIAGVSTAISATIGSAMTLLFR